MYERVRVTRSAGDKRLASDGRNNDEVRQCICAEVAEVRAARRLHAWVLRLTRKKSTLTSLPGRHVEHASNVVKTAISS